MKFLNADANKIAGTSNPPHLEEKPGNDQSSDTKSPNRPARMRRTPPWSKQYIVKDPERFALNLARMIEEAGKAAAAWAAPRERGEVRDSVAEPVADMVKTFSKLSEYWLSDPARALEAQTRLFSGYMDVWANTHPPRRRQAPETVAMRSSRNAATSASRIPEWGKNAFFDFLKQTYLVTARWAGDLVEHADGLDEHTRHKAGFYVKQIANAISPSNFILTNPELFRETVASSGENLVRGMRMLAEDIHAGKGDLKLRQADNSRFEVGKNLATTPGKVVGRSDVAEIIQYDAVDRDGAEAAAADLPALDQQVLHPRPQPGKILHPLGGRAGPHGLRHLLGQSGRAPRHQGLGGLYPRRPRYGLDTDREGRPASARSTPSAIASAARCWRRRSR